jgi:thymidylate synthase (FAD)
VKLIKPSFEILTDDHQLNGILKRIEAAGRTCYKSEGNIKDGSAEAFVAKLIKLGHEAMIEHESVSVRIVCDRGVTHEIVRHRIASYAQESTRYCNYGKVGHVKFIYPSDFELETPDLELLSLIEAHYLHCINNGRTPQQARYFLPNGTKTEIVMTCNLREWRHFFTLRCSPKAHPDMRAIAIPVLLKFSRRIPVIFDDLVELFMND